MTPIKGDSVVLREFHPGDIADAHAIIGDDRVTYWLSFDSRPAAAAVEMVEGAIVRAHAKPRSEYYLAIARRSDDALVGFIRLALSGVRAAKLGYAVKADEWGKGYASEAVGLILSFAFNTLDLHRITAAIGPDNTRSITLVGKYAFQYEGRLRDHVYTNGSWRDSLLYSCLETDRPVS